MNCIDVREFLDRLIFEEVSAGDDLLKHLEGCPACNRDYQDALKARTVLTKARGMNPEPIEPVDLTDRIMYAIGRESGKTAALPAYISQLLAAASIALCMVFSYEQFEVVRKVSALEVQFSTNASGYTCSSQGWQVSSIDIHRNGISFSKAGRLLAAGSRTIPASFMDIQKRLINRKEK